MAQTEDTELRDLVIEALEKNGSLAKIRALLRANIFLAFEDECDNVKTNSNLENILKLPEGILSLSIVHEFLEYCNLKNSLFVYMAESRQGREYNTESKRKLIENLNLQNEVANEPVLITLIKLCSQKKLIEQNEKGKDNCTYVVEDLHSSATSNSQSDISSDEKNKLHLRLQLDNSDTDTSNDSTRDKVRSEYFPSEQMKNYNAENKNMSQHSSDLLSVKDKKNVQTHTREVDKSRVYQNIKDFKGANNSSNSTSYVELKSVNALDEKLFNTSGVPINDTAKTSQLVSDDSHVKSDLLNPATFSSASSLSLKDDSVSKSNSKETDQEIDKSGVETAEYSFDFSPSPSRKSVDAFKNIETVPNAKNLNRQQSPKNNVNKNSYSDKEHQSSQSSISISDVADLLSEKSVSISNQINNDKSIVRTGLSSQNYSTKKSDSYKSKVHSDDSGDFTESPIASLSNLSLDIHSD